MSRLLTVGRVALAAPLDELGLAARPALLPLPAADHLHSFLQSYRNLEDMTTQLPFPQVFSFSHIEDTLNTKCRE